MPFIPDSPTKSGFSPDPAPAPAPSGMEKLLRGLRTFGNAYSGGMVGPVANRIEAAQKTGDLESLLRYARPDVASGVSVEEGTPEFEGARQGAEANQTKFVEENPGTALAAEVGGFLTPGGPVQGVSSLLGAIPGVRKIPDYLMQKAVGLKKYLPGTGHKLIDEGVGGTVGRMQGQVGRKISQRGAELGEQVSRIPEKIPSAPIASDVLSTARRYRTPGGQAAASVRPELDMITNRAGDIYSRGAQSASETLGFKRIAGREGYREGRPLAGLEHKLAQRESAAYGRELEGAFRRAHPGEPNAVADLNQTLSALLAAARGLGAQESLTAVPLARVLPAAAQWALKGLPASMAAQILEKSAPASRLIQQSISNLNE